MFMLIEQINDDDDDLGYWRSETDWNITILISAG